MAVLQHAFFARLPNFRLVLEVGVALVCALGSGEAALEEDFHGVTLNGGHDVSKIHSSRLTASATFAQFVLRGGQDFGSIQEGDIGLPRN